MTKEEEVGLGCAGGRVKSRRTSQLVKFGTTDEYCTCAKSPKNNGDSKNDFPNQDISPKAFDELVKEEEKGNLDGIDTGPAQGQGRK